jgi:hypothetical protein
MQKKIPQGTLQATWKPVSLYMQNKLIAWVTEFKELNKHASMETTAKPETKHWSAWLTIVANLPECEYRCKVLTNE